jgi:hypothetical protein
MSNKNNPSQDQIQGDLRTLAGGIDHAIKGMYGDKTFEFMLILCVPAEEGFVTFNTISGITDPRSIAQVGQHLIDMAKSQGVQDLDPDLDDDVKGHA